MARFTQEQAREFGIGQGYAMALESGSADAGCEGWDGMLINADTQFAREKLGWNGQDTTTKAKRLMEAYCEGCQVGANLAIAELCEFNDTAV